MARVTGKEVKIDWFQVSFDFIPVSRSNEYYYHLDTGHPLFLEFLQIFRRKEDVGELQKMEKGMNGYLHGLYIDEHIFISYGGNKTKNDTYPITLTMSGQGCRTFEIMEGKWIELFQYFQRHGSDYLRIGRIDIALDDYDGLEITPYEILPFLEKNHVVTQFRSWNLFKGGTFGESSETTGFTITLGARGSNQLQIYDKRLERTAADQPDLETSVWYRYEMRFTDEKARQVMDMYTASVLLDDSISFMGYAKQILLSCLELKSISRTDSNKNRWKMHPKWKAFTDSLDKISLNKKSRIDTTIERKLVWFRDDMATTTLEMFLVFGQNFQEEMLKIMSNSNFERKHLNRMNNFLRKMGQKELTMDDIKKIQAEHRNKGSKLTALINEFNEDEGSNHETKS